MTRIGTRGSAALLLVVLSLACKRADDAAPGASPAAATSVAASKSSAHPQSNEGEGAREEFTRRCASCHGEQGTGDGPYVVELMTAPPNFREAKWQGSITDGEIENVIQHGGASVGKSPSMPSFPDFIGKPERVVAMREFIRSFAR